MPPKPSGAMMTSSTLTFLSHCSAICRSFFFQCGCAWLVLCALAGNTMASSCVSAAIARHALHDIPLDQRIYLASPAVSWREGSAFNADNRYRIQVTLEPRHTDNAEHALRFVFLHELGHIIGMTAGVHGFWAAPETWPMTARSPYTRLS